LERRPEFASTHEIKEDAMAPVSVERFLEELEKLSREIKAGTLKSSEYDQRLARVIGELRKQGVDADRPRITAALDDALRRGVITSSVKEHLLNRLGLVT
jgi:uncharacterized protein (UPF0335 family)